MFIFRKIWRVLFSCYLRFEIRPFFALLLTILHLYDAIADIETNRLISTKTFQNDLRFLGRSSRLE